MTMIPIDIKVGGFIYRCEYSKDITNESNSFGSCHNDYQKIFIDPDKPLQKQKQTLLHELLHACTFVSGLLYRFSIDDEKLRPNEEQTVNDLSMI